MNTSEHPHPAVDVIVPVFRGREATMRCLSSVLAHVQATPHEVHVIDDASPDADLRRDLESLAVSGHIQLHTNPENLGFVATVNRGMALHTNRDVVLLNSDTEVSGNWLDRLCKAAVLAPRIATVTPFSNNATFCSYPFNGWTGSIPGRLGLKELDRLAQVVNADNVIDIPTGVGFCLFIARRAIQEVGLFDEGRFGRGYGEENDFCLRAAKAGFRNILAPNIFVFHEGGVSFRDERADLQSKAHRELLALHPDYDQQIADFLAKDTTLPARIRIDVARMAADAGELKELAEERRVFQSVVHDLAVAESAGGYEHRIAALESLIASERGAHQKEVGEFAKTIAELDREIADLRNGLANAETWVRTRERELSEAGEQLRSAVDTAEAHANELVRIRATHLGRLATRWLAWSESRKRRQST